MPQFKFPGAIALMLIIAAAQARAAAPTLPPDVVAGDTVVVVHVDAEHFSPDLLQSAATAVLGANANKVDEPLKKFREKYDKAASAGVSAMTMVAGSEKKGEKADADAAEKRGPAGKGVVYLQLKPGADVKGIETMITEQMKPEEKAKVEFDQAGNFLAMHQKGQEFPVKPDAARAAKFTAALATVGDAAIEIAFIPDAAMRDEMLKEADNAPKGLKEAAPLIAKSQWMTLAITLGNTPNVAATVNAAADADAKTITDSINAGLDDLKQKAANPGQNAGPMAMVGPLVAPLIEGLRPTQAGTQVTVTLKTDALKVIGNVASMFGALGGGPGGGGRGGRPGGPPPEQ